MTIIADLQTTIENAVRNPEEFSVRLSEVWEEVGYTQYNNTVRVLKTRLLEAEDYTRWDAQTPSADNPKPRIDYLLTADGFKQFCMMAETEKGRETRRYYIRVEKEYRKLLTASLTRTAPDNTALYQQLGAMSQEVAQLKAQVEQLQSDRANLRTVSESLYAERPDSTKMVYNLIQTRQILGYKTSTYTLKVVRASLVEGRDYRILSTVPGRENFTLTEAALQELAIVARAGRGCRTSFLPELLVVERSRIFQEPTGKCNTRHGQAFD